MNISTHHQIHFRGDPGTHHMQASSDHRFGGCLRIGSWLLTVGRLLASSGSSNKHKSMMCCMPSRLSISAPHKYTVDLVVHLAVRGGQAIGGVDAMRTDQLARVIAPRKFIASPFHVVQDSPGPV
jgi:hypothetical protein